MHEEPEFRRKIWAGDPLLAFLHLHSVYVTLDESPKGENI